MTELCSVLEQVRKYVGALEAGLATKAAEFKLGIHDTIRIVNSCSDVCDKKEYPLPSCCKVVYLHCGTTLQLGTVGDDFELINRPRHGEVQADDILTYIPNEGFPDVEDVGSDSFSYRSGGVYTEICVEVVNFEATLTVESVNDELERLTIETNCEIATVDWGEYIGETELSIVIPKGTPYHPLVNCGGCLVDIETCITCDSFSPIYDFGVSINSVHDYSGQFIDAGWGQSDPALLSDWQVMLDGLVEDCGEPVVTITEILV